MSSKRKGDTNLNINFLGGGGENILEMWGLSTMYKRAQDTVYLELIKMSETCFCVPVSSHPAHISTGWLY
jgi:hypothetical protein